MPQYLARTLLYLRDKHEAIDPDTGDLVELEYGYVQPGQILPIEVDPLRAEIWLSVGAVAELPDIPEAPAIEPEAPARKRRGAGIETKTEE